MAWIMDTYSMNQGRTTTGVVTGKPLASAAASGASDATGRGVFVVAAEAARRARHGTRGRPVPCRALATSARPRRAVSPSRRAR
jgi:glutamate dehydrogenase/leucine dehydrogenase